MKKLLLLLLCAAGLSFGQSAQLEQMMGTVPTGSTSVTTRTTYIQLIVCSTSGTATTLTVTDTVGNTYFNAVPIAINTTILIYSVGNGSYTNPIAGMKMVGIKWSAGNSSALSCQIQGYQP